MKAHDIRRFAAAITRLATDTGRWGDLGYAPSTLDADIGRYNTHCSRWTRISACQSPPARSAKPADRQTQPSLEGTGEVRLRRLVKEALRMRPDRIVVGEVRQEEALDLLIALNIGSAVARPIVSSPA